MSLTELCRSQDGSLYKIKRLLENPNSFRYEPLSREEITNLGSLLHNNNTRRKQRSAGFSNKPAADFGARTDTSDGNRRSDILQDV
jgi:hypothetical protein